MSTSSGKHSWTHDNYFRIYHIGIVCFACVCMVSARNRGINAS